MIIETLFLVFEKIILWVLDLVDLPDIPQNIIDIFEEIKIYLIDGADLVACFVNMDIFLAVFWASILLEIAVDTYLLIMWILNKIPFIDVD